MPEQIGFFGFNNFRQLGQDGVKPWLDKVEELWKDLPVFITLVSHFNLYWSNFSRI
jgi:hypothetical protein